MLRRGAALFACATAANAQPANDLCEQASIIEWASLPLTTPLASLSNAAREAEAANPCVATGFSVWYRFDAPTAARVRIETCAGPGPTTTAFDTTLALYESESGDCGSLSAVWCNDDACAFRSRMIFDVRPGVRYYVQAGVFAARASAPAPTPPGDLIGLRVSIDPPPPPDHWVEHNDAGSLPDASQRVPIDRPAAIEGRLAFEGDIDLFALDACGDGPVEISTVGLTNVDTQLFLFDARGAGVAMNDDDPGSAFVQSRLAFPAGTLSGRYHLAVTSYNLDPVGSDGLPLWNDAPFRSQRSPDGPGAWSIVSDWLPAGGFAGEYVASLAGLRGAGACTTDCPPCTADFNGDGGVDGADLQAFFETWEVGSTCGDANGDGGVDGADVERFMRAWEVGGC
jgi:hypothetical protein